MNRLFLILAFSCALAGGCAHLEQFMGASEQTGLNSCQLTELGIAYYEGKTVPQDFGKARECWLEAARMGNPAAQFNLGLLCEYGLGVPQNFDSAQKFYEAAAQNGSDEAFLALGNMHATGRGVPINQQKAQWYWQQAAKLGNVKARENLNSLAARQNGQTFSGRPLLKRKTARFPFPRKKPPAYTV